VLQQQESTLTTFLLELGDVEWLLLVWWYCGARKRQHGEECRYAHGGCVWGPCWGMGGAEDALSVMSRPLIARVRRLRKTV
jgi:hypothetical protein